MVVYERTWYIGIHYNFVASQNTIMTGAEEIERKRRMKKEKSIDRITSKASLSIKHQLRGDKWI